MQITESQLRQIIREALQKFTDVPMVPAKWLTREVLDDVANSYQTQSLPKTELGSVVWDKLHDMEVEKISPIENFKSGSLLHRWIVLDAVNSAESIAQGARGKAALTATRYWLADPSEENRHIIRRAVINFVDHAASTGGYTAYCASIAATAGSLNVPHGYAIEYAANGIAAASSREDARLAAILRFRVLAVLDKKGILPAPNI
jgi:hypothetical protein